MGKALTDPLFLALAVLLLLQGVGWFRAHRRSRLRGRRPADAGLRAVTIVVTLLLWLAATPLGARWALQPLEGPYAAYDGLAVAPDHVVVLTGGLAAGPRPALDLPAGPSSLRLDRGVEVFLETDPGTLVLTGAVPRPGGVRGDLVRLMAERARRMGVPEERIVLEPRSRNTREHPVEVGALEAVDPEDRLAVVTSARHLPRALREFRRHFTQVDGVPAEFASPPGPMEARWLLPSSDGLLGTTGAVHEYVGRVWYALRALVS